MCHNVVRGQGWWPGQKKFGAVTDISPRDWMCLYGCTLLVLWCTQTVAFIVCFCLVKHTECICVYSSAKCLFCVLPEYSICLPYLCARSLQDNTRRALGSSVGLLWSLLWSRDAGSVDWNPSGHRGHLTPSLPKHWTKCSCIIHVYITLLLRSKFLPHHLVYLSPRH